MCNRTGVNPSTEREGYASPKMPSNLDSTNAAPGSVTASANVAFFRRRLRT